MITERVNLLYVFYIYMYIRQLCEDLAHKPRSPVQGSGPQDLRAHPHYAGAECLSEFLRRIFLAVEPTRAGVVLLPGPSTMGGEGHKTSAPAVQVRERVICPTLVRPFVKARTILI